MANATDRRQFMQQGAASLILGFPFLSEVSGSTSAELLPYPRLVYPGLLGRAMKRMADECKPGIVLLVRPDHFNVRAITWLGRAASGHDGRRQTPVRSGDSGLHSGCRGPGGIPGEGRLDRRIARS